MVTTKRERAMKIAKVLEEYDTAIIDGAGNIHGGLFCKHYKGCPYATADINGNMACYEEDYHECQWLTLG